MSEITVSKAGTIARTWMDAYGVWHCEVLVSGSATGLDADGVAKAAIADEIRHRGNGAPTEAHLASDAYRVELVDFPTRTVAGWRYEYTECDLWS